MTCAVAISNTMCRYRTYYPVYLADHEVTELSNRWLRLVEHLPTDAPPSASAHCCYIRTVILYEQPYRVLPSRDFAYHWQGEHTLTNDDIVEWDERLFKVMWGRCAHFGGRWAMSYVARPWTPPEGDEASQ